MRMSSVAPRPRPAGSGHRARGAAGRTARVAPAHTLSGADVLALQRDAGNQAVQRLMGGMLRQGSRGAEVVRLQQLLIGAGAAITADGAFGPKTRAAVAMFQKAAGLASDGIVGPKTWGALEAGGISIAPAKKQGAGPAADKLKLLHEILGKIRSRLGITVATAGDEVAHSHDTPEPAARHGWFDDAADWVDEQVDDAADWASEKVDSATDWAGEQVDAATDWAGEQVDAATDWASEQVDSATDWVQDKVDSLGDAVESIVEQGAAIADQLNELAGDVADAVPPTLKALLDMLTSVTGDAVNPAALDDLVETAVAALVDLSSPAADELANLVAGASLDFSVTTVKGGGDFTFDDETFAGLRRTLSARTREIGSAQPSTPILTLNGRANGSYGPDDEQVKSAKIKVVETVTLPVWTNESKAAPDEKRAWRSYVDAIAAHEQLHVDDDRKLYGDAASAMISKTHAEAYDILDQTGPDGHAKGLARDASDPAPELKNAGVEKVP